MYNKVDLAKFQSDSFIDALVRALFMSKELV